MRQAHNISVGKPEKERDHLEDPNEDNHNKKS
jgi:hypothetical protein